MMDPPWSNRDMVIQRPEDSRVPYPVLPLKKIGELPIAKLAEENCHLYIWCMCAFVPHALWLTELWGFKYANLLTWVKPDAFGWNWANRTEHMVFAYKGKAEMKNKALENVFGAQSREHSRKPEISYELIERASFGPYLEIFARRKRKDWAVWGNQVESDLEFIL